MTSDGRLVRTDPMCLGVWHRLRRLFTTRNLILFASFSRRALSQFSNDQMSPVLEARHWKLGLGLLGGLSDAQVDFLVTYASLNADRSERIARAIALLMVTLPAAGIVALNEVLPDIWDRLGIERFDSIAVILTLWALITALLMASAWRARDLADLLKFEHSRRQFDIANHKQT